VQVIAKSRKEVLQEFRTGGILQAARTVFARSGYNDATIDEIAEAAGVAKGTVYLYFESKRELFLATLRAGVLELHAEVQREIDDAATAADKIRAFIRGRLAYCDRNRDLFGIYYTEFASLQVHASDEAPAFQDLYDQQAALLESILRRGIRQGEIRSCNVPRTARLIYDLTRAAIARHVRGGKSNHSREAANELCEFIWKGIQC
jgi:AcrR family transcriptional regulator